MEEQKHRTPELQTCIMDHMPEWPLYETLNILTEIMIKKKNLHTILDIVNIGQSRDIRCEWICS